MVFRFKEFTLQHDRSTMKIGTDAVLLAALTEVGEAQSVLDVGCGCGVVAFCTAQRLLLKSVNVQVHGIDMDLDSVEESRENAQHFSLLSEDHFHFQHDSLQHFSQNYQGGLFDLVVSNPPFFGNDLKPNDNSKLKSKHRDNQLPFSELIDGVLKLLKKSGRFSLILPKTEGEEFDRLASGKMHCVRRTFVQPTIQKPVHRVVQEYVFDKGIPCEERLLVIRDADNQYTEAYRQLTKPFLLNS